MLLASTALHALTLVIDAVILIAIVGGGIFLFRRIGKDGASPARPPRGRRSVARHAVARRGVGSSARTT